MAMTSYDIEHTSNSILNSVKKMLGYPVDLTEFDVDIIVNINSAIAILSQLGVGPPGGFEITGSEETYEQYLNDITMRNMVSKYLFIKTKLGFDSATTSSFVLEAYRKMADELEQRLMYQAEVPESFGGIE